MSNWYIIGGGASLRGFDWTLLSGRKVLGCNAAFYLGVKICPQVIFGDSQFWKKNSDGLILYVAAGGKVYSNSSPERVKAPYGLVIFKPRVHNELGVNGKIGWCSSTGSAAINLALYLGASIVYLLGFDMKVASDGRSHFHNAYEGESNESFYRSFRKGMEYVRRDLPVKYPGCQVINLTEDSALDGFPKESLKDHFSLVGASHV